MSQESSRQHGAGTYQMLWDCRFCGTQKLLGVTHRHCPNCGAAQDPAWRYMPAEADMVALENHQYVGADKVCPACKQPNSAAATYCGECGADLATGKIAQAQQARDLGTGAATSDTRRDVVQDQFVAEMQRVGVTTEQAPPVFLGLRKNHLIIGGIIVAVVVVVAAVIWAVTYRKDVSAVVTAVRWEYVIDIQDYQPRREGSWQSSMPAGTYNEDCYEKENGTRQIPDGSHEECRDVDQGDGSMRRECHDVQDYRDATTTARWCDYTIDRWAHERSVRSSGNAGDTPAWPTFTLANPSGQYGDEREGEHHELYIVEFTDDDGKERSCEFDGLDEWSQFTVGAAVTVKVGLTGGPDCDTLRVDN